MLEKDRYEQLPAYDPNHLVTHDGVRPWHVHTMSTELPDGRGFKLWIGDVGKKWQLIEDVKRSPLFTSSDRFTLQIPRISSPAPHRTNECGPFWLGISYFPLPENWTQTTAAWPGWRHLIHWSDWGEAIRYYPPEKVFEVTQDLLLEQGGYPEKPVQFVKLLAENLQGKTPSWLELPRSTKGKHITFYPR